MIHLKCETALEAWEKVNELFLLQKSEDWNGSEMGEMTNSWYAYNLFIEVENPVMEPKFDYAKYFHFSSHKWSRLIGNYLNLDALDELRDYVRQQEKDIVRIRHYSVSANFDNTHGNGKGCITNCVINRILSSDVPEITIVMRAIEVTSRFAVDMNFIYRFGQYIFGNDNFKVKIFIKQAMALEHLLVLYSKHKPLKRLTKRAENKMIVDKIKERHQDFLDSDESKYKTYAVFFRPYKVIRSDVYETPKPLLAEDMEIGNWEGIPLPAICPTLLERDRIKSIYMKMVNKYKMDFTKVGERNTVVGNNISLSGARDSEDNTDDEEPII